jgi:hypothetical protein
MYIVKVRKDITLLWERENMSTLRVFKDATLLGEGRTLLQ